MWKPTEIQAAVGLIILLGGGLVGGYAAYDDLRDKIVVLEKEEEREKAQEDREKAANPATPKHQTECDRITQQQADAARDSDYHAISELKELAKEYRCAERANLKS